MKKLLFSMTLLCFVSAAGFAQSENVSNDKMKNGSFEIISKTPRGSSSYLLKCILLLEIKVKILIITNVNYLLLVPQ